MNWVLRLASRALEPGEREAVLGDLAERGATGARPVFDVIGLVVRRQLLIWTNWQPWVALIGIAGVSGFYLSGMLYGLSVEISQQVMAWQRYGVHYNTGVTSFRDDVIQMGCLAAAIFFWSAVNASLLRRLSGRAAWLTGLLFYIVVHDSSAARFVLSGAIVSRVNPPGWASAGWIFPLNPVSLCFVVFLLAIPAICGATGRLPAMSPAAVLCTLAAVSLAARRAHDLQTYSNGEFPAASWQAILAPYALVSWPLFVRHRLFRLSQ